MKRSKFAFAANEEMHGTAAALGSFNKVNMDATAEAEAQQAKTAALTDGFNKKMQEMGQQSAALGNEFKYLLASSGILDVMFSAFKGIAALAQTFLIPAFNILTSAVMKIWTGFTLLLEPVITALSGWFGGLGGTLGFIDGLLNVTFTVLASTIDVVINILDGLFNGISMILQPISDFYGQIFTAVDGVSIFTDIIYRAGSFIGKTFEIMGFLVGEALTVVYDTARFVGDMFVNLYNNSETLRNILGWLGTNIKMLYEAFKIVFSVEGVKWMLTSAKDAIVYGFKDMIADLSDAFGSMVDRLLKMLPIGGIDAKELEARDAARAQGKVERIAEAKARAEARDLLWNAAAQASKLEDKKLEDQKDQNNAASSEFAKHDLNARKLNVINGKTLAAAEAAQKAADINANLNGDSLLLEFAKKEGSPLLPKNEASAGANNTVAAIAAAAEAKKAADAVEASGGGVSTTAGATTTPAATQESAESLLSQLNTNMARLIALTSQNLSVNNDQLSAIKNAGSVY
jgi:hypothetical protein